MAELYEGAEKETVETRMGGFWDRSRLRREIYNARAGFVLIALGALLTLALTGQFATVSTMLSAKNVSDAGWWILISKLFYTTVLPFVRVVPTKDELKDGWTTTLAIRSAGYAVLSGMVVVGAALIVAI